MPYKDKEKQREYKREYYRNNKEKIKEYREQNKEQIKSYCKKYRERNKEQRKAYYEQNKEQMKSYCKEYYEQNKEQRKAYCKEYYEQNKEQMKSYHLQRKYNLTIADKERKIREQDNKCVMCNKPFSDKIKGKGVPHIDHDHVTGKVRDILCGECNRELGYYEKFMRDEVKVRVMEAYLQKHAEKELRPATHPVHTSSGLEFLDKGEAHHAKTKRRNPKSTRAVCERGQMAFSVQGIKSEKRPAL